MRILQSFWPSHLKTKNLHFFAFTGSTTLNYWFGFNCTQTNTRLCAMKADHNDPTSPETHVWGKWLDAMLAIYTGRGVTPEVNFRECISCTSLQSSNKTAHSGFKTQRRRYQKSETFTCFRLLVMDMCPTKILNKKSLP